MKILYLTPAWYGFKEILFDGRLDLQGLPSFLLPLKSLIDSGNQVDFVIMHTSDSVPPLNIAVDWLKESDIKGVVSYKLSFWGRLVGIYRYRRMIAKLLRENSYDFVYAHGTSTALVRGVVRRAKVAFGQRLYGTFFWDYIKKHGLIGAAFRHPVEFLSFTTKKDFLLVTNDGSRGDLVKEKIFRRFRPPYDFRYWINGVSRVGFSNDDLVDFKKKIPPGPFLFYCARFDYWKRHDRVINIISLLKKSGLRINAIFAGPFDTLGDECYRNTISLASDAGVDDQVYYLGSIPKKDVILYHQCALASLSLYDVCNLTNVFHEMMACGALAIVRSDGVVNDFIESGVNGFLVEDDQEVVDLISRILADPAGFSTIRENAIKTSRRNIKDWAERIGDEIDLIRKYAE